jgi:hypothetical protein
MPHPLAEKISDGEFDKVLAELSVLLQNLPSDMPRKDASESAFSAFLEPFVLDQKYLSLSECEVATLSEMLKRHIHYPQADHVGHSCGKGGCAGCGLGLVKCRRFVVIHRPRVIHNVNNHYLHVNNS